MLLAVDNDAPIAISMAECAAVLVATNSLNPASSLATLVTIKSFSALVASSFKSLIFLAKLSWRLRPMPFLARRFAFGHQTLFFEPQRH